MKTLRTGRNVIVEIKYTIRVSNSLLKMASSREVNFATNYEAKENAFKKTRRMFTVQFINLVKGPGGSQRDLPYATTEKIS